MDNYTYYTYITTNKTKTTLYIGVTNDLFGRVKQHKDKINKGFTSKYNLNRLVYYEEFEYIEEAIAREKQLKAGSRKRKEDLIRKDNPSWDDLSKDWD